MAVRVQEQLRVPGRAVRNHDRPLPPRWRLRFNDVEGRYIIGPQRKVNGAVWVGGGQFFDGTRTEVGYRGRIEVTSRFGIEPGIAFNWVDLAEGSFLAELFTARATYNFSPRMTAMGLVQYNSEGGVLGVNARFRWEFRPGSDLERPTNLQMIRK